MAGSLIALSCLVILKSANGSPPIGAPLSFGEVIPFDTINFQGTNLMPVLHVSIPGSQPQALLIDSGSSSMAFCDHSLEGLAKQSAEQLSYTWCAHYEPGGAIGYVFNGSAQVVGFPPRNGVIYSVMDQKFAMPCGSGLGGIAGVGFRNLNEVTKGSQKITPWNMTKVRKDNWAPDCPKPDATLPVNLWSFLRGKNATKRLGIYWEGKVGNGTGSFYLDDAAVNNPHFNSTAAQKVLMDEFGWMSFQANKLSANGKIWNATGYCGWSKPNGEWDGRAPCIMDTGTPIIEIPAAAWTWSGRPSGPLKFELVGVDGPVNIQLDAGDLYEKGWLVQGGEGIMLGIPFWAYFYTVVNQDDSWIQVVPLSPESMLNSSMEAPDKIKQLKRPSLTLTPPRVTRRHPYPTRPQHTSKFMTPPTAAAAIPVVV